MTSTNILQSLQYNDLLKITTVSEVMQTAVVHASPSTDLLSIAQIIASENIGSVVIAQKRIVQGGEKVFPVGIIAERDIKLIQTLELDLANIQAKTVMNSSLFSVRPTDSLFVASKVMQHKNLQQLLVVGDEKELVGIVTLTSCFYIDTSVKKTYTYYRDRAKVRRKNISVNSNKPTINFGDYSRSSRLKILNY